MDRPGRGKSSATRCSAATGGLPAAATAADTADGSGGHAPGAYGDAVEPQALLRGSLRNCIVIELADGTMRAFAYPDEDSAAKSYSECRRDWNAGGVLLFYLRPVRGNTPTVTYPGDNVSHLERTTRRDAEVRGIECLSAVIVG